MRRAVVLGTIVFCLGAACFDIAAYVEQWPFSQYPMYAGIANGEFAMLQLYGIRGRGEFQIPASALQPFNASKLSVALARIEKTGNTARLQAALRDCLRLYRGARRDPSIQGIRLYQIVLSSVAAQSGKAAVVSRQLLASFEEAPQ